MHAVLGSRYCTEAAVLALPARDCLDRPMWWSYARLTRAPQGTERRPIRDRDIVVFGAGDSLTVEAAEHITAGHDALDVLLIGGLPLREPIASHGPFVMNTRQEIAQALDDFQRGRLGIVPAQQRAPRQYS